MHNLTTNIAKFHQLLINAYGAENLTNGNFCSCPSQPKAFDIDIVTSEAMQIDFENIIFQFLKIPIYNIVKNTSQ
jgi:hypothetical protein